MEDKLKKTTARCQAINAQCDEAIAENQVLITAGDANRQSLELL